MRSLGARIALAALRLKRHFNQRQVKTRPSPALARLKHHPGGEIKGGIEHNELVRERSSGSEDPIRDTGSLRQSEHAESMRGLDCSENSHRGRQRQLWRKRCEMLAKDAIKSGGLSHDLCVERYSEAVDHEINVLPSATHADALKVANEVFDYRSPEERQQAAQWNLRNGYCVHGITLECCPLGCGSVPDDCC